MEDTQVFDTLPPIVYDTNLATIAKLREEYMPLEITDLEDKEQYDAVHAARMVMVKVRTAIEKQRKAQKAAALDYGRAVDAAAGKLYDESTSIEEHLQTEEDKVLNEQKRIKEEETERERVKIQERVDTFGKYHLILPYVDVVGMSDDEFGARLSVLKTAFEEEEARKEAKEKELAARQTEIDRIAAEQEIKDREQAKLMEALKRDRDALEREKRKVQEAKDRAEFEVKAKEEARIKAEKDAAEKVAREKREAEEKERQAKAKEEAKKAEAARQEALKPDKEKLIAWAEIIDKAILITLEFDSKEATEIYQNAIADIDITVSEVKRRAEEL